MSRIVAAVPIVGPNGEHLQVGDEVPGDWENAEHLVASGGAYTEEATEDEVEDEPEPPTGNAEVSLTGRVNRRRTGQGA